MDKEIYDYLVNEKGRPEIVAEKLAEKIMKHEDIKKEFIEWLKVRNFNMPNPLEISGYTARDISEIAPHLSGIGVYNFMATLRDNPDYAKQRIAEGFVRK